LPYTAVERQWRLLGKEGSKVDRFCPGKLSPFSYGYNKLPNVVCALVTDEISAFLWLSHNL